MKTIYLTVDTECHDFQRANQYIDGYDGRNYWGIKKILELGRELNIPINFFVDVGESIEYGDSFIKSVIEVIHDYDQPVFFHLHPDYITGDHTRSFLWEYSYTEKLDIFHKGLEIYKRFANKGDTLIFRAGRYGVDSEFYDILAQSGIKILDLSYLGGPNNMCKVTYDEVKVYNTGTLYKGLELLPNTRFIALDLFGIKKCVGLDTADATFSEFKRYLQRTELSNLVLTMHSWNFIRKWFFAHSLIRGDKAMERKFRKSVKFAQDRGFSFGNLNDYVRVPDHDELINMSEGPFGIIRSIANNFVRFQKIARLNKKYFIIYSLFYMFVAIVIAVGVWIVII